MDRPEYIKDKLPEEAVADDDIAPLCNEFVLKRNTLDALEEQVKKLKAELDELSDKAGNLLEAKHLDLVRTDLGSFWPELKNYPSVVDKDGFIGWLDENGMGAMAKRSVHPKTLEAWVKDWLKNQKQLPPHINNFAKQKLRFRRK